MLVKKLELIYAETLDLLGHLEDVLLLADDEIVLLGELGVGLLELGFLLFEDVLLHLELMGSELDLLAEHLAVDLYGLILRRKISMTAPTMRMPMMT